MKAVKVHVISINTVLINSFILLLILPSGDGAARFTKYPPSVLFVSNGGTARFVWDYHVDNKAQDFLPPSSPIWFFDKPNTLIAVDYSPNNWQWTIVRQYCPPRLLNPTRVSKESTATLVIKNVTSVDNGTYGCALLLRNGPQITSTSILFVTVPPMFIPGEPPSVKSINENQDLKLQCSAFGYPSPNVTWYQWVDSSKTELKRGVDKALLVIPSIHKNQSGTYECEAINNKYESPITTQTTVFVNYRPVIHESVLHSKFKSWNGNIIRLKCLSTGLPLPRISWYKPTNQHIIKGVNVITGGSEVTIQTTADPGDYGQYKCRATNLVGSDEQLINVTQLFPPVPVNITVIEIGASSITVRWARPADDGGKPVISYLLEVNTRTPESIVNTLAVITHLEKDTQYTVRVYAKNDIGYGMVSAIVITTKKTGKPAIPELFTALFQAAGSTLLVYLRWTKPDDNGSKIVRYVIYVKKVTRESDWTKIDIINAHRLEYKVMNNIVQEQTYMFQVTAWNKYGESVRDNSSTKSVNTTTAVISYPSVGKSPGCCKQGISKYCSTIIGVISAIVIFSLSSNVLLIMWGRRKIMLDGEKRKPT